MAKAKTATPKPPQPALSRGLPETRTRLSRQYHGHTIHSDGDKHVVLTDGQECDTLADAIRHARRTKPPKKED